MFKIETGEENDVLRSVAAPVSVFDSDLEKLVSEMEETMMAPDPKTEVKGVGLAANQVGVLRRVILIALNLNTKKDTKILPMINPEILKISSNEVVMEEGCLSLPGEYGKVKRAAKVWVRWQNVRGDFCEKKFEQWDARIFLHEFDHLEGRLFVDYL